MNTVITSAYQYQVGGILPINAPTYIIRQADFDLYEKLKSGQFCYILNSPQLGKSSLMLRTMQKLQESGIVCVIIDMKKIANQLFTPSQLYASIAKSLLKSLQLQFDWENSWYASPLEILLDNNTISPSEQFEDLLEKILLVIPENIVIFLDNIDSISNLNFSIEDFFTVLRKCYDHRHNNPDYQRLTWAFLGVGDFKNLISVPNKSPFTIAKEVKLTRFQLDEVWCLMQGLITKVQNPLLVFKEILAWTGGQPLLTQQLCQIILKYDTFIPTGNEEKIIKFLVHSEIIDTWQFNDNTQHFKRLRDHIFQNKEFLELYQEILLNFQIPSLDDSHAQNSLIRLGLITKINNNISIANRIYAAIFNINLISNWRNNLYIDFRQEAAIAAEKSSIIKIANKSQQISNSFDRIQELTKLISDLSLKEFIQYIDEITYAFLQFMRAISIIDVESQSQESTLGDLLEALTSKIGQMIQADRTTFYLIDEEKNELWSLVAKNDGGGSLEIRISTARGYAGRAATSKKVVNIPYDLYDDPDSTGTKEFDKKTGYRTYSMLTVPLVNENAKLVAVVQLINKLKSPDNHNLPLAEKVDPKGFTKQDIRLLLQFAPSICLILESSHSFDKISQKQRAADALMKAISSLSQSNLDLEETLKRVMDEAKRLMNADRSTLWLIDEERNQLWTKIPIAGVLQTIRIPRTAGFAGQVAETRQPLIIPFDLYNHPNAETSKQTDQKTGYRTCSMLCMPVFNGAGDLIGVTQLINKKKQGEFPAYNPADWPNAPDAWKASFNSSDLQFMQTFNIQAGVALQNAKLFDTIKQQEQTQRDILRSLSNGVIYTDKEGKILAANESAKILLGFAIDDNIEAKSILDIVQITDKQEKENAEENKLTEWFQIALKAVDEKSRKQYYPDQILQSVNDESEKHTINLSINTISDANDPNKVSGALVVIEDVSDEKRMKDMMYRYMSQEVAEQLLKDGAAEMGGSKKEVSVLFSDIRSYTTLTESMNSEEVVKMLNEYFESMVEAVFKNKGTLDKYIGDAIMAVFGSPLPLEDHAWMAVQTAIEMRHRLTEFNTPRAAANLPIIKIGIGINSGEVISGNIGSSRRMEHTAIGDAVNLGSRLEGASKQYGVDIIISETTYQFCADRVWVRELDRVKVKGKNEAVSIYELVGLRSQPISSDKQLIIQYYTQGREHYLQQEFQLAYTDFEKVIQIDAENKAAKEHLKRCEHWLEHFPSDTEWDHGVWTLTDK